MPTSKDREQNTARWRKYFRKWRAAHPNYHREWMAAHRDTQTQRRKNTVRKNMHRVKILGVYVYVKQRRTRNAKASSNTTKASSTE